MDRRPSPKRTSNLHLRLACCAALVSIVAPALAADAAASAPPAGPAPITVIELPGPVGPVAGAQPRTHHALSIATDAPKTLLRSLGIEASDCALRFRVPTRVVPTHVGNAGARLELQAQAGLACRY